jgi:electron transfer flavoprotein alpha subunit
MSGSPLVFIERSHGEPTDGSLSLVAKARKLFGRAAAVVCGPGAEGSAGLLARFGADQAWWADSPGLEDELGAPQVDALAQLIAAKGFDTVLFDYSIVAGDVAAGLSARLRAGVNWDLQALDLREGELVGTRLALVDSVSVEVGWVGEPCLAVFRSGVLEPVEVAVAGSVHRFEPEISEASRRCTVVDRRAGAAGRGRLGTADVIVAGGRGVRDLASMDLLEDLAAALDGVVAVSMPLVDRGWRPPTSQVGQTGQKVRPKLYVACGISGALGHRVGMEKSGTIVAINTDPAAPIFGICDLGVVGDLHEVVPRLAELIRERTGVGAAAGDSA